MLSERINNALLFAIDAHHGQVRKYEGGPYIKHCIRVAYMVADIAKGNSDAICAALLHDVIEDCPHVSPKEILDKFGDNVYAMVVDLTHPPLSFGNREKRKEKETDTLHKSSPDVQTIKLADCIDNIPSIVQYDKRFAPRFVSEKSKLIPGLNRGNPILYKQAVNLLAWAKREVGERELI